MLTLWIQSALNLVSPKKDTWFLLVFVSRICPPPDRYVCVCGGEKSCDGTMWITQDFFSLPLNLDLSPHFAELASYFPTTTLLKLNTVQLCFPLLAITAPSE